MISKIYNNDLKVNKYLLQKSLDFEINGIDMNSEDFNITGVGDNTQHYTEGLGAIVGGAAGVVGVGAAVGLLFGTINVGRITNAFKFAFSSEGDLEAEDLAANINKLTEKQAILKQYAKKTAGLVNEALATDDEGKLNAIKGKVQSLFKESDHLRIVVAKAVENLANSLSVSFLNRFSMKLSQRKQRNNKVIYYEKAYDLLKEERLLAKNNMLRLIAGINNKIKTGSNEAIEEAIVKVEVVV